jgi:hypothetical protein
MNGNSLDNTPEFLMPPADLISGDYWLPINVARRRLSNMMRSFSCSNICLPISNLLFKSIGKRQKKGSKIWVTEEDICHDFIKKTSRDRYPRDQAASHSWLQATVSSYRTWQSLSLSRKSRVPETKIITFLGNTVRWVRRADNLTIVCEPTV